LSRRSATTDQQDPIGLHLTLDVVLWLYGSAAIQYRSGRTDKDNGGDNLGQGAPILVEGSWLFPPHGIARVSEPAVTCP
jgi:hypothetical protein